MDTSGLSSVTTSQEMLDWLAANCISPIKPVMSGTDFGVIMEKVIQVTGGSGADSSKKISYNFYQTTL